MRIVIDMQGAQGENRFRGIGRYTLSLVQAIVRNRGEHEVILALNGLFPETIEPIGAAFDGMLPQENIRIWQAVGPVSGLHSGNDGRRERAELVREAFLASLKPDIVHVSSLFEGIGVDTATSIGHLGNLPTSVTVYDFIPYIHRCVYLDKPEMERWYFQKLDHLRRADLWLSISESSRQEGIKYLSLCPSRSINISTAADPQFKPAEIAPKAARMLRDHYGLDRPFVMYGGGIDHRKNLDGLIPAFASLPADLRQAHQLAIVCAAIDEEKQRLLRLAKTHGLTDGDVVFTGFVTEDDLVALYNLCKLFVFPSWHEGFGLPALEAMQCGAPVIGADTSSVPEVIGLDAALFDPHSVDAMTAAIERCLTDGDFRARLVRHGKARAQEFSWDASARRAIEAFERFHAGHLSRLAYPGQHKIRPKLAYVSPFPPVRSGIADYSAELLPELARHYQIELIVAQENVSDAYAKACWPIRSVEWFIEHAAEYQRVLYHFGNSAYHQHMFESLKAVPGVVVLHDFFLSGVLAHMEQNSGARHPWVESLYRSHGYGAVGERFLSPDSAQAVWKYPCNLGVLREALGMIVHSAYSRDLAGQWYGKGHDADWAVIPLLRRLRVGMERSRARATLGLDGEDFIVCSFGIIGPHKLSHRLLNAWLRSRISKSRKCRLIFVGENDAGKYGQDLVSRIKSSKAGKRIQIIGWAAAPDFLQYLAAADVGVQLRALSRGETSAAVLDCMNHGLATIANANGSMAELPKDAVWMLPDEFSDDALIEALESLWQDADKRSHLGSRAQELIRTKHNPRSCGEQYAAAIERFYENIWFVGQALAAKLASAVTSDADEAELISLAKRVAQSVKPRLEQRQLLVDVSELVQRDAQTGIQRVVRSILDDWLKHPPAGYRVEPVYATVEQGYKYARRFSLRFLGSPAESLHDEPIDYAPGDVFVGLDLQPQVVPAHRYFYQVLRRYGVRVVFVAYDMLCVQTPGYFVPGASEGFTRWLDVVAESDGAVCISKSTAEELNDWVKANGPERCRPFKIDWFHLGVDGGDSVTNGGRPANEDPVLTHLRRRPSFLMVGTIEPRKGYEQALGSFEALWNDGMDVNLVIVGKQGWMVENLVEQIRAHSEAGDRLFWLDGIGDEYLEQVYANSSCLIAASYGEGFGLPLIEAARHGIPIIARDIPVFREVAGKHAYYFGGLEAQELASAVTEWLSLHEQGMAPRSDGMPRLTWRESAEWLMNILISRNPPQAHSLSCRRA